MRLIQARVRVEAGSDRYVLGEAGTIGRACWDPKLYYSSQNREEPGEIHRVSCINISVESTQTGSPLARSRRWFGFWSCDVGLHEAADGDSVVDALKIERIV